MKSRDRILINAQRQMLQNRGNPQCHLRGQGVASVTTPAPVRWMPTMVARHRSKSAPEGASVPPRWVPPTSKAWTSKAARFRHSGNCPGKKKSAANGRLLEAW